MRTNWKNTREDTNYYIQLTKSPGNVYMTEDTGHWKSETGGFVSYERFLEGVSQDWVRKGFGKKVLQEVIAAVKELLEEQSL